MAKQYFVNCRAQGHFLLIWRQLPIKANRFLKDTKHGGICCLCEAVSLVRGASWHPQSPEGCGSLTMAPRHGQVVLESFRAFKPAPCHRVPRWQPEGAHHGAPHAPSCTSTVTAEGREATGTGTASLPCKA